MKLRGKILWYLAAAVGLGVVIVRVFFWPERKRTEIVFDLPTDDVTAEDFIIKGESISGGK